MHSGGVVEPGGDSQLFVTISIKTGPSPRRVRFEIREVDGVSYRQDRLTGEWEIIEDEADALGAALAGRLNLENMAVSVDFLDLVPVYRVAGTVPNDPGVDLMVLWVGVNDLLIRRIDMEGLIDAGELDGFAPPDVPELFQIGLFHLGRFNELGPVKFVAPPVKLSPTPRPGAAPTPGPTPLTEVYTNEAFGYSMSYPAGWTVSDTSSERGLPEGSIIGITHSLGTNIFIAVDRVPGATPEEFLALSLGGFTLGLPGFKETSRTKIDEPPGYLIEGEASTEGLPIIIKLIFTVDDPRGFSLGAFVLEALHELHQPILDRMIESFQILPLPPPPPDDHGDEPATATAINLAEPISGTIEPGADLDFFSFSGMAGTTYKADVQLGTLGDSFLSLYSPDGMCVLTTNDDYKETLASAIRWRLTETGTHYLAVENADFIGTGTYTLIVETTTDAPSDNHGNQACSATSIGGGGS